MSVNEEKLFLCSFCGLFIKKNRANLIRHENLHKTIVGKILCSACESTFQNKTNYWNHWVKKHIGKIMPNTLNTVKEHTKYKTKYKERRKNQIISVEFDGKCPDFVMNVNVEDTKFDINEIISQCYMRDPFFGKF